MWRDYRLIIVGRKFFFFGLFIAIISGVIRAKFVIQITDHENHER